MSSGTDTNSSGVNTNIPAVNANNSGANADGSGYRDASVVSGLAASIAAQLYGIFKDRQSYTSHVADDQQVFAIYTIASFCYAAVGLNLAAAMTAFILMDWKAKNGVRSRFVLKLMLNVAHAVWLFNFYVGILLIILSIVAYAYATYTMKVTKPITWMLIIFLCLPVWVFGVYISKEASAVNEKVWWARQWVLALRRSTA